MVKLIYIGKDCIDMSKINIKEKHLLEQFNFQQEDQKRTNMFSQINKIRERKLIT